MSQQLKSRRETEEYARKEHILQVAERLFAKQGLHDTSMAVIARKSEFGVGTLYKYFKDKNTLIQSLLETRLNSHFDEMDEIFESEDEPYSLIHRLIDCHIESVCKRKLFFIIYFTHFHPGTIDGYSGYSGSLNHVFMQQRKMKMLTAINNVLKKGIDQGVFANIDSKYLSTALFGMFISFSFLDNSETANRNAIEEKKQAIKRILFDRVLISNNLGVI